MGASVSLRLSSSTQNGIEPAKVAQFTKQTSAESRGATFTAKDGVNMQYGHVAGALCAVLLALLVIGG